MMDVQELNNELKLDIEREFSNFLFDVLNDGDIRANCNSRFDEINVSLFKKFYIAGAQFGSNWVIDTCKKHEINGNIFNDDDCLT